MKLKYTKIFLMLFALFVFQTAAFAQNGKKLTFADNTELTVNNNFFGKEISSVTVVKKELITELSIKEIGKAVRFNDNLINAVKKGNHALAKKLQKITSAFAFTQNNETFYLNALNSVNDAKLRNCDKCLVKINLTILEICAGENKFYVPVIEQITPKP